VVTEIDALFFLSITYEYVIKNGQYITFCRSLGNLLFAERIMSNVMMIEIYLTQWAGTSECDQCHELGNHVKRIHLQS